MNPEQQLSQQNVQSAQTASSGPTMANNQAIDSVLKLIHSDGNWSIGLGLLVLLLSPLLAVVLYSPSKSGSVSKSAEVITALVIGLIQGGILIWLGVKLKKVTAQTVDAGYKTLKYLAIFLVVLGVLGLITTGRGFGILNLILLIDASRAMKKIRQLRLGPVSTTPPLI
jgi:predicted ferric reductase